jgi:hypothetical protein
MFTIIIIKGCMMIDKIHMNNSLINKCMASKHINNPKNSNKAYNLVNRERWAIKGNSSYGRMQTHLSKMIIGINWINKSKSSSQLPKGSKILIGDKINRC